MLRKTVFVLMLMLGLVLYSFPAWSLDFDPGLYEITSTVSMPGMQGASIPPQTVTQCMTKQDPVPNKSSTGQRCEIKDMEQNGNTITWSMECDQQGQIITSEGKMVYHGNSFEGTIATNMGTQAGNMTMTTKISGKRISGCQ